MRNSHNGVGRTHQGRGQARALIANQQAPRRDVDSATTLDDGAGTVVAGDDSTRHREHARSADVVRSARTGGVCDQQRVGDVIAAAREENEVAARATDDFYVPEAEDVRTQVGKPGAYSFDPVSPEVAETTREELRAVYDAAYSAYERLVEQGVARELARLVMPVGAYTEFYWTVNARSLMNFVSLRAAETAQREIRRYADACEVFFAEKMPVTHAAFVAAGRVAP